MGESDTRERRAFPRARGREPLTPGTRRVARWMFHGPQWLGVMTKAIIVVFAIHGILLNHKRPLGLMPAF